MENTMLKPDEMTPQGFAKLLRSEIAKREYLDVDGQQRGAARQAGVSTDALSDMVDGVFPRRLKKALRPSHRKKVERGALSTLIRVCDTFGFDLDTALEIFMLPKDEILIEHVRREIVKGGQDLVLHGPDIDMLRKQVEIIGPIPFTFVPELVRLFRREGNTSK